MREPGLTFCEPDVERFSEERLKAPLGPLGSMMKIQTHRWSVLSRSPQSSVMGPTSAGASTLEAASRHLRWNQGMSATSGILLHEGLTSFQVSGPLSSLQLTPNWQDWEPSRDINHWLTHLTHTLFSSTGHPIIRLNAASSYEASQSNGQRFNKWLLKVNLLWHNTTPKKA